MEERIRIELKIFRVKKGKSSCHSDENIRFSPNTTATAIFRLYRERNPVDLIRLSWKKERVGMRNFFDVNGRNNGERNARKRSL